MVWSRNVIFYWTWQPGLKIVLEHGAPYPRVKHCLDFFFVFSTPLPAWRNLFPASGIFCGGRCQPGSTGIFWPAEGASQPVTTSKKWKNQGSTLRTKWTCVQALLWHPTYSLGLPVRAQISNHRRACTQALLLYIISCSMPGWNDFEYLNCCNVPQFALSNLGFKFLWPIPKLPSVIRIEKKTSLLLALSYMSYGGIIVGT